MGRQAYRIFSEGGIANLTVPNRLVRSATWDPGVVSSRRVTDEVLDVYREVALGGVGLVITGGFPVFEQAMLERSGSSRGAPSYDDLRIDGVARIADVVHAAGTGCPVLAQLEPGYLEAAPSDVPSPFTEQRFRPLTAGEIGRIVDCFVEATVHMKEAGFDGVQLHAAHGGLLSAFLSPYTNRRNDAYGGSLENRVRVVREIVSGARERVGGFPILIKMNATDYVPGGIDIDSFPELAGEIARCGVDAIEVSGGMWDCLVRTESELGFRPVPAPESHTGIGSPDKQSYFREYAERLALDVPIILVGGNRDVERLEQIVRGGKVDFIALCRPLISEPDLPRRWREGRGGSGTDCISCNACIYDMIVHPGREIPGVVRCLYKSNRPAYKAAQDWLAAWVEENVVPW